MTRYVNLTPHIVRIYLGRSLNAMQDMRHPHLWMEIPVSGHIAHIEMGADNISENGLRIRRNRIGRITGLPDPVEGVTYIVSSIVGREAMREDLISPDTRLAGIFDENNELYAVRRMQQWTRGQL